MKLWQKSYQLVESFTEFGHLSGYEEKFTPLGQLEHAKSASVDAIDQEVVRACLYPPKHYTNALTLGGAPLLRRSVRAFIGQRRWAGVACAVPGVALALAACGAAPALVFAAMPFWFIPHRGSTTIAAWEWRLCAAIDRRIQDKTWGETVESAKAEHELIASFKALVKSKSRRLRESDSVFFHILRWEGEANLRLQAIAQPAGVGAPLADGRASSETDKAGYTSYTSFTASGLPIS